MIFDVLTLFPEMIENYCGYSILKRALENDILKINTINPRDFTLDKHRKVDAIRRRCRNGFNGTALC